MEVKALLDWLEVEMDWKVLFAVRRELPTAQGDIDDWKALHFKLVGLKATKGLDLKAIQDLLIGWLGPTEGED